MATAFIKKLKKLVYKNKEFVLIATILFAGFFSYINIFNNEFLWDDEFLIQKNVYVHEFSIEKIFTTSIGAGAGRIDKFYRPMQLTLYSLVYQFFGETPQPFHLLNIILHLANAILIFFLIKKIFKNQNLAFLTSLIWVIHPIHTEAVTYISGTADPLACFFSLLSLLSYYIFKEKKRLRYLFVSLLFFSLVLLSKESYLMLPLLIILIDFIKNKKKLIPKNYLFVLPYLVILIIFIILRLTILNFESSLEFYSQPNIYTENYFVRLLTFLASLPFYYSFLILPVNLHIERSFPVFTTFFNPYILISLSLLILIAYLIYKDFKNKKILYTFAFAWFFICLLPVSGIMPVNSFLLEHWLYMPSISFCLLVSYLLLKLLKKNKLKKYGPVLIFFIVITLFAFTLETNTKWKNSISLYNHILKYEKGTARIYNNLAMAYADEEKYDLAKNNYLKAIKTGDIYAQTHYNLARIYIREGKIEMAIKHLERSLEINKNFYFSHELLGKIYENIGESDLANYHYRRAEEIEFY